MAWLQFHNHQCTMCLLFWSPYIGEDPKMRPNEYAQPQVRVAAGALQGKSTLRPSWHDYFFQVPHWLNAPFSIILSVECDPSPHSAPNHSISYLFLGFCEPCALVNLVSLHSLVLSFSPSLLLFFSPSLLLSFPHSLIPSFSHSLILSISCSLNLSFSQSLILTFSHPLILSSSRSPILSFSHRSLNMSFSHYLIISFFHSC